MHVFVGPNPNFLYQEVTEYILRNGDEVSPRGKATKEIQPAINEWQNPCQMVITVPGRMTNPFFTLFESLWIVGGRGDAESVCFYNSNLKQFLDEGYQEFHAPYGRRIRHWGKHKNKDEEFTKNYFDQLVDVYNLLNKDVDTRQAVITLWLPPYDNCEITTNDRPCNDMVFFKIRNNYLNMSVLNRSNDLHLGLYSANIMQFSMLQRILASCLHVEVGMYRHFSDSLHIYLENDTISERILTADYSYNVYNYFDNYDLRNEYLNLNKFDECLVKFFSNEELIRLDNSPIIYTGNDIGKFLHAVLHILKAYKLHKLALYEESIEHIFTAFNLGLKDHCVSCLEFVYRKYQKIGDEFAGKMFLTIEKYFRDFNVCDIVLEKTLEYIRRH